MKTTALIALLALLALPLSAQTVNPDRPGACPKCGGINAVTMFVPTGRNHVGGILVGSIVEGSDAEVTADPLMFPFTEKDWDTTIEWVEGEVDFLWHEANDDEDVEGEE